MARHIVLRRLKQHFEPRLQTPNLPTLLGDLLKEAAALVGHLIDNGHTRTVVNLELQVFPLQGVYSLMQFHLLMIGF